MKKEPITGSKKAKLMAVDLIPHRPITKKILITRFGYRSGSEYHRTDFPDDAKKSVTKEHYNKLRKFVDSNQEMYDSLQKEFAEILADNFYYEHLKEYLDASENFQITIGDGTSGENKFFTNRTSGEKDIALDSMTALYALKWNKNQKVTIVPLSIENFDILVGPVSLSLSTGDFLYLRPQAVRGNNRHSDYVLREFQHIDEDGRIKVSIPETDQGQEEENIQDTFGVQDIGMIPILALSRDKVRSTLLNHGASEDVLPQDMRETAH